MSFQLRCIGCVCCKRQDIGDLIFVYSMCFFLSLDISSSAIKPNPLTVNDLFFFPFFLSIITFGTKKRILSPITHSNSYIYFINFNPAILLPANCNNVAVHCCALHSPRFSPNCVCKCDVCTYKMYVYKIYAVLWILCFYSLTEKTRKASTDNLGQSRMVCTKSIETIGKVQGGNCIYTYVYLCYNAHLCAKLARILDNTADRMWVCDVHSASLKLFREF